MTLLWYAPAARPELTTTAPEGRLSLAAMFTRTDRSSPRQAYNRGVKNDLAKFRDQTLLFDADDTLWENNIYFERAIASFISYLDHREHTREEVRSHLNHVEHATILSHGYGLHSFRRSLITCFEQLTDAPLTEEKHRRIESFAQSIADQEIELLPQVASTLADLATRHRLILV